MSYQPPCAPSPSDPLPSTRRGGAAGRRREAEYELGELIAINQTFGWVLMGLGVLGLGRYLLLLAPPADQPQGWLVRVMVLAVLTMAPGTIKLLVARALGQRRGYAAAVAVGVLDCVLFPVGTVLGAYCLYMLKRPGVRALLG